MIVHIFFVIDCGPDADRAGGTRHFGALDIGNVRIELLCGSRKRFLLIECHAGVAADPHFFEIARKAAQVINRFGQDNCGTVGGDQLNLAFR